MDLLYKWIILFLACISSNVGNHTVLPRQNELNLCNILIIKVWREIYRRCSRQGIISVCKLWGFSTQLKTIGNWYANYIIGQHRIWYFKLHGFHVQYSESYSYDVLTHISTVDSANRVNVRVLVADIYCCVHVRLSLQWKFKFISNCHLSCLVKNLSVHTMSKLYFWLEVFHSVTYVTKCHVIKICHAIKNSHVIKKCHVIKEVMLFKKSCD